MSNITLWRPDAPWLCFVCGLDLHGFDEEPWGPSGQSPTYNYCPCCGVEFGYGDFSLEGARRWRRLWIDRDMDWQESARRPGEWDPDGQLAAIPERAR